MPISIPKFFQRAFAQNGSKQNVPVTGDTSGGRASYDVGFPPVTRVPIVAGGIPPFGTDFNGILYDLSQAIQYLQSGVTFPFDQDFADAIGGYSIKAIVADPVDPTILWQNNNANNTLPPSVPNGWEQVFSAAELIINPTESQRGTPFLASNAEADAGVENTKMMSAQKVLRLIRSTAALATETLNGVLRISTSAESQAGTSSTTVLTPERLRSAFNASGNMPVYACRAWWNFDGTGTPALRASGNIFGITDNGTGDYTVNFSTPFPDAAYAANITAGFGVGAAAAQRVCSIRDMSTTYVRYLVTSANSALEDVIYQCGSIFR